MIAHLGHFRRFVKIKMDGRGRNNMVRGRMSDKLYGENRENGE